MSAVRSYLEANYGPKRRGSWTHAWDQWTYTDYFFDPDPALMEILEPMSDAGLGTLAVALLEWNCFHFDSCEKAKLAQEYADAAWVGLFSPGSCDYVSLDHADWAGPADGPLRAAALIVNDVLYDASVDGQFALRACWAIRLAKHCCEAALSDSLAGWIAHCINRIDRIAPNGGVSGPEDLFAPTFAPLARVSPMQLALDGSFHLVSIEQDLKSHRDRIVFQNRFLDPSHASDQR